MAEGPLRLRGRPRARGVTRSRRNLGPVIASCPVVVLRPLPRTTSIASRARSAPRDATGRTVPEVRRSTGLLCYLLATGSASAGCGQDGTRQRCTPAVTWRDETDFQVAAG